MSLVGITLVTGILVDDAIVEIENIVRHIQRGRPAYQAAMEHLCVQANQPSETPGILQRILDEHYPE